MSGKNNSNDGCATCLGGIIAIGFAVYLISNHPVWATIIGVLLVIGFVGKALQPTRCQVCGNPLKRNIYQWNINGKQKVLCAHCNQQMERNNSRDAMKNL